MGKINIVGIGPGAPEYITPAANNAVKEAQVLIGAKRSLNLFLKDSNHSEKIILNGKNYIEVIKYAQESINKGKNVTILSTGDPGFSGLLNSFLTRIQSKKMKVNVIPGISSIQICAAKLSLSWDDAKLFTFHHGTNVAKKKVFLKSVKNQDKIILIPDSKNFIPSKIAMFLIKNDVDKNKPVVICENLTLENERIIESTLENICDQTFAPLSIMVIKSK